MELLTRFRTSFLIVGGVLVFAIAVYMAVISPQSHKLTSLKAQETQLQAQQTGLQAQIAQLRRDRADMASTCAQLSKALTEIPGTPNVDSFLQEVTALAVASGDPNTPTFSYTSAAAAGGVTPISITMTLSGSYGQMSAFLKGLDSFPRLFTVNSISVTGGPIAAPGGAINPATAGYNLTLAGSVYYSLGQKNVCDAATTPGSTTHG
ncbi:MAG TPA: type 4a pilus biogenesis protein PilO [Acidimicrobiales bacterium]|nr:type 4a pilus biogenesis protein PilO [Acidimicrobiales bacterium]